MSIRMRRIFAYVLPCVTGAFSCFWPLALSWIVFLNGFIMGIQNLLFRLPWFRNLVRIQPRGVVKTVNPTMVNLGPKEGEPKNLWEYAVQTYKGIVAKGRDSLLKKTADGTKAKMRTKADVKKMRSYEEKVKREVAQRRFEAKQAAEAKAEERRQRGLLR